MISYLSVNDTDVHWSHMSNSHSKTLPLCSSCAWILFNTKYVILAALLGELVTIRLNDNDIWCVLSVGKS